MKNVTQIISDFVAGTRSDQIPKAVIEIGKLHILDTWGCMLAGSKEDAARIVISHVRTLGGDTTATIVPLEFKTSPAYAALANGVIGHVLDYDDYEMPSMSMAHPSVTVLPAVLALGEKVAAGGKECLAAYLAGMEVISRAGGGVNPSHYDKGWHSTCTLGPLGSAAASSKMLKLGVGKIRDPFSGSREKTLPIMRGYPRLCGWDISSH